MGRLLDKERVQCQRYCRHFGLARFSPRREARRNFDNVNTPHQHAVPAYTKLNQDQTNNMSSIADGPLGSDIATPQGPRSDAPSTGRRRQARSSSRPRGPPSVSTPGMQSDAGGFPDDEVVGTREMRRRMAGQQDIPRVVDTTAETLGIQFERFLEKYDTLRLICEHC